MGPPILIYLMALLNMCRDIEERSAFVSSKCTDIRGLNLPCVCAMSYVWNKSVGRFIMNIYLKNML